MLVQGRMRARHVRPRTVQAYMGGIVRHIRYYGTQHPAFCHTRREDSVAWNTYLSDARRVAASTQLQSACALLMVSREVLAAGVGELRRVLCSTSRS